MLKEVILSQGLDMVEDVLILILMEHAQRVGTANQTANALARS